MTFVVLDTNGKHITIKTHEQYLAWKKRVLAKN